MSRWATDVAIVRATVEAFEDYLFSDSLYRTLLVHTPHGDSQPTISAGRLLADLRLLAQHEGELSQEEQAALQHARAQADLLRRRYESRYVDKLQHELAGHISSWRWFLDDCLAHTSDCAGTWRSEAPIRLRIEMLLEEIAARQGPDAVAAPQAEIEKLDRRLRMAWQAGPFVLKDSSPEAYPRERFWFLYGTPRPGDD